MRINAHTRVVALLGYPVSHSLSPLIHNTAFAEQGLNYAYLAHAVAPDDLRAAVSGLKALRFAGANVTIPHKEAALLCMGELSEQARAVGAVNTIVVRGGDGEGPLHLYGDNTDVAGFLAPLQPYDTRLAGAAMTVLGAGGAARAVVYGLLRTYSPASITIAARTPEKAESLIADLRPFDGGGVLQAVSMSEAGAAIRESRLVVNATPLGMHPHEEATPWPYARDFSADHVVYDLIYNPLETRLLREAGTQGAATLGGLAMLIGQAAAAYAQWTGHTMPAEAVARALARR